jgi:hypothetical protein
VLVLLGVLLGVLFTIILAGLDNTIVSTVIPVALPELGGGHLYAWTFAPYMLAAPVSLPIWGLGSDRWGRRRTYLVGIVVFHGRERTLCRLGHIKTSCRSPRSSPPQSRSSGLLREALRCRRGDSHAVQRDDCRILHE